MTKINTLKIIIAKSSSQSAEAAKAIMAINKKSPAVDMRCNNVAVRALEDLDANFTEGERTAIADLMSETETESREFMLRVRLTSTEHAELEEMAGNENLSISEYVRRKIFK